MQTKRLTPRKQPKLLSRLFVFSLLIALQACGFHIRTAELDSLGFKELALNCDSNAVWDLCQGLQRELRAHNVTLNQNARLALTLSNMEAKERVFTINSDASADEFELTRSIKFKLSDKANASAEYVNEVSARRIYRHNSDELLAKDREQETITRALDNSLAREIIRQLTLIRIGE